MNSKLLTIACVVFIVCICPVNLAHTHTKRSVGGFFKRIFSRTKQGFQGTANANNFYNAQQSSYFPNYYLSGANDQFANANSFPEYSASNQAGSFAPNTFANGNLPANFASASDSNLNLSPSSQSSLLSTASNNYPQINAPAPNSNQYFNNYPLMTAASSANTASHLAAPQNIDFSQVLDNFVRSAGLSPNGDHETAASNVNEQKNGDTPVFSFKKLYSFPFYLNTDPHSNDNTYFNIPYMNKHIKRISSDSNQVNNQAPQLGQSINSATSFLNSYFGGKKLSDLTKFYNHHQKYFSNQLNNSQLSSLNANQLKKLQYLQLQKQLAAQQKLYQDQLIAAYPELYLLNGASSKLYPNYNLPVSGVYNSNVNPSVQYTPSNQQILNNNNKKSILHNSIGSSSNLNLISQFTPVKVNQPSNHVQSSISTSTPIAPIQSSTLTNQQIQVQHQQQPKYQQDRQQQERQNQERKNKERQHQQQEQQLQQQLKKKQQEQDQQQLIQQAINNPQAFISQYITQQYSNQPNNLLTSNNSNKLTNDNLSSDTSDEYNEYYYGNPQVSVSSSTSTKINHKPSSSSSSSSIALPGSNQSSSSNVSSPSSTNLSSSSTKSS